MEKYKYSEIEEIQIEESSESLESSLLLDVYALIPRGGDGGCGSDGGSDGGPPFC